jgi:hypothetical protein
MWTARHSVLLLNVLICTNILYINVYKYINIFKYISNAFLRLLYYTFLDEPENELYRGTISYSGKAHGFLVREHFISSSGVSGEMYSLAKSF